MKAILRKILHYTATILLISALSAPTIDARGRKDRDKQPTVTDQRPGGGNHGRPPQRPGGGNNARPPQRPGGGNHARPPQRPGGGNHARPPQRPGGGNNARPSQRPGGGGNHARPPQRPGYRPPAPNPGHVGHPRPPYRPHYSRPMIPHRHYRPAPPPRSWRPSVTWPRFRTVLGVSFGTSIGVSLDLLLNSGYTISAYGDNCIYLDNVRMLNCYWSDAALYYASNGGLLSGSFVYSTAGYDLARYNMVYNDLSSVYGYPYNVANNGSTIEATWWGGDQYITLSYRNGVSPNGSTRFYTTLSFGN